ncbi:MAG TPA: hypothetical protein VGE08_06315 [Steroidobacter sp.]|uniref:hypothetical protein n=1 Tax=Steroidobacter sp. TaxID=1978227 RepID=UPI002ED9ED5A
MLYAVRYERVREQKATPPKAVATGADVKMALAGDPKAIGYIDKSEVDDSVKVVFTAS